MSQVDTRQLGRDSLFLLAQLRFEDQGGTYRVKVRNLSSGGMMGEGVLRVTQGASVHVEVRNIGWVSGTVVWTADGRFGIAFSEEIDPKLVRAPVTGAGDKAESSRYIRPRSSRSEPSITSLRKI